MKRSRAPTASSSTSSSSRAAPKRGQTKWLTSGHKWLGAHVWRVFDGEGVSGTVVKWARAQGDDDAVWHVRHEDGDEEDLDEPEMHQAIADFELHADDGPISRNRPKRKSAEASATRWAANIKEYNEDIWSSADEEEDDGPRPSRRATSRPRPRPTEGGNSGGGGSDDDDHNSDNASEESSESEEASAGDECSEDDSDERGSDDEWGASSGEEESPKRRQQTEGVPPEDTSAEAAAEAALDSRRDLRDVSDAVWADVQRAAADAHDACMQKRSRASRSGGTQVAAYYQAEDAAKAVLKRAYPRVKSTRRAAARAEEDAAEPTADIERERKRNIARNHEVLASLGLA